MRRNVSHAPFYQPQQLHDMTGLEEALADCITLDAKKIFPER